MEKKTESSPSVSSDKDRICPICWNRFESQPWSCRTCSSEFHFLCILEWLMKKYNCPCCRANNTPIFEARVSPENVLSMPSSLHDLRLWILYLRLLAYQISVETSLSTVVRLIYAGITLWFKLYLHTLKMLFVIIMDRLVYPLLRILLGLIESWKDFVFDILRSIGRGIWSFIKFLFLWPLYLCQAVKTVLWDRFKRLFQHLSQMIQPKLQGVRANNVT